ncbi:hypothetical protein NODU109028_18125 [Nocardioides dubius]|uniref:DUF6916 domain-containing protein n=1 Tax=Nocardioides dubius TaxID=317019 RepID=A0ABN1U3M1_9ACTN
MPITYAALAARLGAEIEIETSAGPRTLRVVEAVANPDGHPGGSLLFTGPEGEELGQDSYPAQVGDQKDLLFLVPIGPRDGVLTYQAIFG